MVYVIIRMLMQHVAYLVGIVICNSFVSEIFWVCVMVMVAFDSSNIGTDWGLSNFVLDSLEDIIIGFEEVIDQGLWVKGPFKVIDKTLLLNWYCTCLTQGLLWSGGG